MRSIRGNQTRLRLSVFRSNKAIYAQIIDDDQGRTLVAASERDLELNKKPGTAETRNSDARQRDRSAKTQKISASQSNSASLRLQGKYSKTERARMVGELLAKKALKKSIQKVVFDRGSYRYHGRVKALAEGARQGGLEF